MAARSDAVSTPRTAFASAMRMIGFLAMLMSLAGVALAAFSEGRARRPPPIAVPEGRMTVIVEVEPVAPEAAPVVAALPARLIGWPSSDVVGALGTAAFARQEGRSRFWRYASERCVLFVFMHRSDGVDRVEHVESRPVDEAQPVSLDGCVASLQRGRILLAQAR